MEKNRISVIVFSKGRPMQLHAYLESLLRFSDAALEDITILCCETEGIRYDKVRKVSRRQCGKRKNILREI